MTNAIAWALVFLAAINSTIGNLRLKKASGNEDSGWLDLMFNYWFIGGVVFYAINAKIFVKVLSKLSVSTAYHLLPACSGFLLLTLMAGFFP